ncbi:penicillin-binding protein activator [Methylonatrum kenyense]|uniref:penicillin-binding protein activator n=1 Tax=Methylonatrum kenyense TaxID=455253 RepID=UPI0020BE021E|nr:penicillin-binding protein activator [Methylonatrum kenyense]MCK8516281.1 penicillin-binding protein activator [Methylonatrum kenyense]
MQATSTVTVIRLLALAACILALAACETTPPPDPEPEVAELAADARARGDLDQALALYDEALADTEDERSRALLNLRAAEVLLLQDQRDEAAERLESARLDDPDELVDDLDAALRGRMALLDEEPEAALERVEPRLPGEPGARRQLMQVQAEALAALGRHLESAEVRSELEEELRIAADRERNREALWQDLMQVPMNELQEIMPPPPDVFGGWVELAFFARSHRFDRERLRQQLEQWAERYEGHPAGEQILAEVRDDIDRTRVAAGRVAVLLPLSGSLADAGRAVRDGMLAAHFSDTGNGTERPQLRFVDVGEHGVKPRDAYERAVSDGAELVIGPLTRDDVETVVLGGDLPVPLLALNGVPRGTEVPRNLFRFGLMPEHDAAAAGRFAAERGFREALVFVPMDDWGRRVNAAFTEAFEQGGGRVVARETYTSGERDHANTLRRLLGVTGSRGSDRAEMRKDADLLFLGAFPDNARLIMPQIRFHHGENLPVIATSHVYTGNRDRRDDDIKGLVFMDAPWMVGDTGPSPRRTELARHWDDQLREQARLVGMGLDTYRLIPRLRQAADGAMQELEGATGLLRVSDDGEIVRGLVPAQFTDRGVRRLGSDNGASE